MRAYGYLRVSTDEQGDSGLGLDAQRAAIEAEAARRGWAPVCIAADVASGKSMSGRHELAAALDALDKGRADVLIVAKLDRLARSLIDFASIMERARRRGWAIVCLDLGTDTSSATGELTAHVLAAFAQHERRLISERTRDALRVKKARGARLGRPVVLADHVRARIAAERAKGRSLRAIAEGLNADAVPTAQGGARWYGSTVRSVLAGLELDAEAEKARRGAA